MHLKPDCLAPIHYHILYPLLENISELLYVQMMLSLNHINNTDIFPDLILHVQCTCIQYIYMYPVGTHDR